MNDIDNNKTPSQDAQGRWYELLSPTQVLTGEDQPQLTESSIVTTAQSKGTASTTKVTSSRREATSY